MRLSELDPGDWIENESTGRIYVVVRTDVMYTNVSSRERLVCEPGAILYDVVRGKTFPVGRAWEFHIKKISFKVEEDSA